MMRDGDRCVAEDLATVATHPPPASQDCDTLDASKPDAARDASQPADAAAEDGDTPIDARVDGQTPEDGGTRDAAITGRDAESELEEAGDAHLSQDSGVDAAADSAVEEDGTTPDSDGSADARVDADATPPEVEAGPPDAQAGDECSDADLAIWRAFQISGQLIPVMASCFARDPSCSAGACDLDACLRQTVGVTGCVTCVAEETRCAVGACAAACGASDSSDACRACACSQGCIGKSASCGMGSVDVCADCSETSCNHVSLDPALIMVIID